MRAFDLGLRLRDGVWHAFPDDAPGVRIERGERGLRVEIPWLPHASGIHDVARARLEIDSSALLAMGVRDRAVGRERVVIGEVRVPDEDQRRVRRRELRRLPRAYSGCT